MGIPFTRFIGPSTTFIALCVGAWYLLTNAPTDGTGIPSSISTDPTISIPRFGAPKSPSPTASGTANYPYSTNPTPPASSATATVVPSNAAKRPTVAVSNSPANSTLPNTGNAGSLRQRAGDRIRIATFNIQDFGPKKLNDPTRMAVIAQIIQCFDLVGIQEISSVDLPVVDQLLQVVNQSGGTYRGITSPRIGRSAQKEQYAFVWDAARIDIVPKSDYVVSDPSERMHREPFITSFQVRLPPQVNVKPFRFTIINVHTDPDLVGDEMNALDDVFRSVRAYEYPEDDILLMGDLNVSARQLGEMGQIPGIVTLAGSLPTNTRQDKQYDHLIVDSLLTKEFIPGRSGVFSYERELGLNVQQALSISDHCPVWAEFRLDEQSPMEGPVASRP